MNPSKISTMLESCGKIKDLLDSPDSRNVELGYAIALSTNKRAFELEMLSMVEVQGGTFTRVDEEMNSQDVTLDTFCIGKYQVTQFLWEMIMGTNPSSFIGEGNSFRPLEQVPWGAVQLFLEKLNAKTGKNYRLPTEAEWEYAARGGNQSKNYKYSGSNDIDLVAWYDENSNIGTHFIGQKRPNELGIYDMSGNVAEWLSDWYGAYSSSSQSNPKGPSTGAYRVVRGGSWLDNARHCCSSDRQYSAPGISNGRTGFRLAL